MPVALAVPDVVPVVPVAAEELVPLPLEVVLAPPLELPLPLPELPLPELPLPELPLPELPLPELPPPLLPKGSEYWSSPALWDALAFGSLAAASDESSWVLAACVSASAGSVASAALVDALSSPTLVEDDPWLCASHGSPAAVAAEVDVEASVDGHG